MIKKAKELTWDDDLGEYEHLRFQLTDKAQKLPDDEIRRILFGTLEKRDEPNDGERDR